MGEMPLTGGRLTSGVVRVGDTVRRPKGPHSTFVHRLLRHLEAVGFDGAPRLQGVDKSAARLLRRLHDATAGSALAAEHEVVCHNDPSPCNFVFVSGHPRGLIDFDHAAPGDRLRDVVYAGWLWTISADDGPPIADQARRLRLMADAYELDYTRPGRFSTCSVAACAFTAPMAMPEGS